jgi:uncharacterized damage-inducible protein DinB
MRILGVRTTRWLPFLLFTLAGGQMSTERIEGQAPLDPVAASVAPVFAMIERSFLALAEAMPADRYDFAPEDGAFTGVRTFAEQVKHVACSNFAFFNEIEGLDPPDGCNVGGPHPASSKAELVDYLRESFQYGQDVIAATTRDNILEPTDGPYGGQSTRLALTTIAVWHASDHYGQLVVYLRMNGLVPPASLPAG